MTSQQESRTDVTWKNIKNQDDLWQLTPVLMCLDPNNVVIIAMQSACIKPYILPKENCEDYSEFGFRSN